MSLGRPSNDSWEIPGEQQWQRSVGLGFPSGRCITVGDSAMPVSVVKLGGSGAL